jgi:two-component system LytT family response regulator
MSISCQAMIVDDEALARNLLRRMLRPYDWLNLIPDACSVTEAAHLLEEHKPDLIFLDVNMPRLDGFALLPLLTYSPRIIFVTAHDSHAVRAFEVNAIDYLLKPVHPERLEFALTKVQNALGRNATAEPTTVLRDGDKIHMVQFRKIGAIQAEGSFTRVHLLDSPSLFIRRSIGDWEAMLPQPPFLRLDRSLILNLTLFKEAISENRDNTTLKIDGLDTSFIIGRVGLARLKQSLRDSGV